MEHLKIQAVYQNLNLNSIYGVKNIVGDQIYNNIE